MPTVCMSNIYKDFLFRMNKGIAYSIIQLLMPYFVPNNAKLITIRLANSINTFYNKLLSQSPTLCK